MADELSYESSWTTTEVTCPQCNSQISYYDRRKSAWFGCPQCGAFFERASTGRILLRTFDDPERDPPGLKIGTRGKIDGKEYVLVGYVEKKEESEDFYWCEYLFYSPDEKWYVVLAEMDGHWMIVKRSEQQSFELHDRADNTQYVLDDGWRYELYLSYKFTVVNAEGEFDWNVLTDEELVTYEYVAAPNILINELRGDEYNWYRARYISPAKIIQGFNIDPAWLAYRTYFNPATFYPRWKPLARFTGLMLALLVLVIGLMSVVKPERTAFAGSFNCEADTSGNLKPFVSPSFNIHGPAALDVNMYCGALDNSWLELPVVLINDSTGKVYEIEKVIEYYQGYDDDGSWSEGGRSANAFISHVPSGSYHMNIFPATDMSKSIALMSFDVTVKENSFLTLNFWLMLLAIITYPVIQWIRKYSFENSKWFADGYGTYKE